MITIYTIRDVLWPDSIDNVHKKIKLLGLFFYSLASWYIMAGIGGIQNDLSRTLSYDTIGFFGLYKSNYVFWNGLYYLSSFLLYVLAGIITCRRSRYAWWLNIAIVFNWFVCSLLYGFKEVDNNGSLHMIGSLGLLYLMWKWSKDFSR